jgi:hypothetical protein
MQQREKRCFDMVVEEIEILIELEDVGSWYEEV